MATGHRGLTKGPGQGAADLRLVPLPVDVARRMLARDPEPEASSRWHPEYPLSDSLDAIAMAMAAHQAMTGAADEPLAWWIHQIVVDGVVVGDIGFHGPPAPDGVVEIGYSVVPAWRGHGVATWACDLILQQAWQDGAEIVIAETDHDNVASQAVLVSNGFQHGEGRDRCVFMIKRPEVR